jgi:alpha-glucosidase
MRVKEFEKIERIPEGYLVYASGASVKICFMTDGIVRIRTSFTGKFVERSYALVTTAWDDDLDDLFKDERRRIEPLHPQCEDHGSFMSFSTASLTLIMRKSPLSFALVDRSDGSTVYEDLPERAFDRDYLGRVSHYSLIDAEHDHFFGFGEQTGDLDKRGRRMRLSPKDAIGHDPQNGGPLYKHIPFYIRVNDQKRRYLGLFYNNSYDAVFDMGCERSGYWQPYCYYQADGGDIDLFLIYGPDPGDVVRRYCMLTGTSAMPTFQEMEFTASTMYYAELEKDCDKEILRVVRKHLDEQLYIDNFWLASGYSSGEKDNLRYTFNWNRVRFPDPDKFCRTLAENGVNVIPNLKPGVLEHHPYREFYRSRGAFVMSPDGTEPCEGRWWGGPGFFIDFTSRRGREAWIELLKKEILDRGVKVVWNDNCEYDGIDDREARVDGDGFGGTMAQYKIIQSNMMAYTARQALAEKYPKERPFITSRAGFAGIQRYAQVWDGDNRTSWETLKYNVATILGMGVSGVANTGCDIGGFAGPAPEAELLLRWIQNGIFQPRFTINSANSDNTVTQPWMYPEYLPQIRRAWALRYRLLPYIYSLMREAHEEGLPVMRPLFMQFPDDPHAISDRSLSFMFGPGLLVASVLEKGARVREIYLPRGHVWYDIADHFKPYEGGRTIRHPVDRDSIPMFLCDSAIVVSSDDIKRAAFDKVSTLKVLVAAASDVSFGYYEDDGHTRDFERGVYSLTTISAKPGERLELLFETKGTYRSSWKKLEIDAVSPSKGALFVSVGGRALRRHLIVEDFEGEDEGWYYDLSSRIIRIKCARPEGSRFKVVVSTEKFDLIGMTSKH